MSRISDRHRHILGQEDPCPLTVSNLGNRKLTEMEKNGFKRMCCGCNAGQFVKDLCSEDSWSTTVCDTCTNGGNQGIFAHSRTECIPPPISSTSLSTILMPTVLKPLETVTATTPKTLPEEAVTTRVHHTLPSAGNFITTAVIITGFTLLAVFIIGAAVCWVKSRRKKHERKRKKKKMSLISEGVVQEVETSDEKQQFFTQHADFLESFIEKDLGGLPNIQVDPLFVTKLGRIFCLGGTELNDLSTTYKGLTPEYLLAVCKRIRPKMSSDEAWIDKLFMFLINTGHRLLAEELDKQLDIHFHDYAARFESDHSAASDTEGQSEIRLTPEQCEIRHSRLEEVCVVVDPQATINV